MQTKLTLSVTEKDKAVIKKVSTQKGKSVSQLVVNYFNALAENEKKKVHLLKQLKKYKGIVSSTSPDIKAIQKSRYENQVKKQSKHILA